MKKLISWYAFNNDFEGEDKKVNPEGPTYQFHKHFYEGYDEHIILSSRFEDEDDPLLLKLTTTLKRDFKEHRTTPVLLGITDVIDLVQIKAKVERLLLEYKNDEIDIFFSPGTSAMQVVWYISHQGLGLKTRLLQTRAGKFKGKPLPELIEIEVGASQTPYYAVLSEKVNSEKAVETSDYRITESIKKVYDKAGLIAKTDKVTCLIRGESGVGKEHLANYIHKESSRSEKPFIVVNCSAFGDELLESRLFGYKKGAFTGANEDRKGILAEANGGTVFLDEIGDITPYMQQVLLRVIQTGEYLPVGSTVVKRADIRFLAATHKNLEKLCKTEKFRWDLYYRLTVVELEIPNLEDRGSTEKKEMINFFLEKAKKDLRKPKKLTFEKKALELVLRYRFPGNIRELENLILGLNVFCTTLITVEDLPQKITEPRSSTEENLNWNVHEAALIQKALDFYNWNQNKACRALGYKSINTLRKKINDYDL